VGNGEKEFYFTQHQVTGQLTNNDFEMMWKEAAGKYFAVLSWSFP
jgi:hypothetical protein